MPKVGNKHFPYTEEGMAAARAYAKKTGQEVDYGKGKGNKKRGKPHAGNPHAPKRSGSY